MKKLLFFFLFICLKSIGQSVTIYPQTIDKQNSNLDDIKVTSFGTYPSIIGLRANGTVVAPTALSSGDIITQIGIRGFNGTTYSTSRANIRFKTTQTWTPAANGTSITFETTSNNSISVAQRMVINQDGNVGIGTTNPSYPISFPSTTGDKISLWGGEINNTTNHYGMGIQGAAFQLFVPTDGDNFVFGVGRSASFSEKLRVTGNGNMQIQGLEAGYRFFDRLDVLKSFQWYSNAGNAYLFRHQNGAGNVMTILENGNVGIGTNTPNGLLQFPNTIFNRKIVLWETANNDHQFVGLGLNGNTFRYQVDNVLASHVFYTATSASASKEIMRIQGNGNVGIGVSNPNASLSVIRGTGTDGSAAFFGTTHVSHFNYSTAEDTYIRGGKANSKVIINDIPSLGSVQIGSTATPAGYKMSVDGKIICTELEVLVTPWPDYVFKPNYKLKPLQEVEKYITENGHLPNIPKAQEIENKSLAVGNMSKLQMEKIEELTLYLIEMNKRIENVENENNVLKSELFTLKSKN